MTTPRRRVETSVTGRWVVEIPTVIPIDITRIDDPQLATTHCHLATPDGGFQWTNTASHEAIRHGGIDVRVGAEIELVRSIEKAFGLSKYGEEVFAAYHPDRWTRVYKDITKTPTRIPLDPFGRRYAIELPLLLEIHAAGVTASTTAVRHTFEMRMPRGLPVQVRINTVAGVLGSPDTERMRAEVESAFVRMIGTNIGWTTEMADERYRVLYLLGESTPPELP